MSADDLFPTIGTDEARLFTWKRSLVVRSRWVSRCSFLLSRLSLLVAVGSGSGTHTRRSANDETIANNLNFFILCFGI